MVRKLKWIHGAALAALLFACTGGYLIKPQELTDWQVTKAQTVRKVTELKQILGESYQLYRGYQIKRLTYQEINGSDFRQILLELFEMGDESNARSIYRRYQTFNKTNLGTESSIGPGFIVFYRRHYFVRLTGKRNLLGKEEQMLEIARLIDAKLSKK